MSREKWSVIARSFLAASSISAIELRTGAREHSSDNFGFTNGQMLTPAKDASAHDVDTDEPIRGERSFAIAL